MESLIQVAESFLGGTLGDRIHPGKFGLLEVIQFAMQVNSRRGFSRRCICCDFALEPPVVSEAGAAGVFVAKGSLIIIQLQLSFVAPMNAACGGVVQLTIISLEF